MTTLFLIRHGQTDWNADGRWQGQADPPLNARGREQAHLVARELVGEKITLLYSSDLRRARETAQIIGEELGLAVVSDERFREINLGVWQGMLSADIQRAYPHEFREWHTSPLGMHPPGGEDILTLASRVMSGVNEIIERHPHGLVGIVAHEFPIAVILCRTAGIALTYIREMIPRTGTWKQVVFEGELK